MKKFWRLTIFILSSILLLLLFVDFLLPKTGKVTRKATIQVADSVVWNHLTDLQSYYKWFPWQKHERIGVVYYDGGNGEPMKGLVFQSVEDHDKLGRFHIEGREGDSVLYYTLFFKEIPEFYGAFYLKGDNEHTTLVWELKMYAGWKPWWRFYAAMMSKTTDPVLDHGLKVLKQLCENN